MIINTQQSIFHYLQNNISPVCIFAMILLVYICFLKALKAISNKETIKSVKFTTKHYLLVMSWVPLNYLILTIFFDTKYSIFFFVTGIAGIIGETILSMIWDVLLDKPIWTYREEPLIKGYTSIINFLPWTMGAFIFLSTARLADYDLGTLYKIDIPYYLLILISGIMGTILAIITALLFARKYKSDGRFLNVKFSIFRFFVFCIPIFSIYIGLTIFIDLKYIFYFIFFALVGNITEYLFGKFIGNVFGHRLWTYNYLKIDNGHSSLTNLPFWALGGLYFSMIADLIGLI